MKQIFEYRYLIYELAFRDLKLRYRKPLLGFLWMFIIPFCTAVIYKVLFSDFMHVTSGEYPFFIHLITAMLPWNYFVSSIQGSARGILDARNIINQISFPKYLLPISIVFSNLINFLPTILVLLGFLILFHINLTVWIVILPIVILIQTCLIIGLSFLAAGLEVIYRDVEYIIQVVLMALFFLTPGVYTIGEVINRASPLFTKVYMLNPLVGILNLYRVAFIGGYLNRLPKEVNFFNMFINPILWAAIILFIGYLIFKKCEKRFRDYVNL
jgi:lipopolysaccharide transport system permease protein